MSFCPQGEGQQAQPYLEMVVEVMRVVTVVVVRLVGRLKMDPLSEGAMLELMLVTMLPMPIQKAMMSPANRPTMAPCPRHSTLSCHKAKPSQQSPAHLLKALPTQSTGPSHAHGCGARDVTHRRVGTRKEHPKAEESKQWPPDHAKDADCCLGRTELRKNEKRTHRPHSKTTRHCLTAPPISGLSPPPGTEGRNH